MKERVAREERWREAIQHIIPSIEEDVLNFLIAEIIDNEYEPIPSEIPTPSSRDNDEDTLNNLIGHHLSYFLDFTTSDISLTVRDILYRYQNPVLKHQDDQTSIEEPDKCELCDRSMFLTIHHLFPRSEHDHLLRHPPSNLAPNYPFTKQDLLILHRAWVCRPCHSAIHRIATNRELGESYWSVELLLGREDVRKWVGYASKQRGTNKNHSRLGLRYKR